MQGRFTRDHLQQPARKNPTQAREELTLVQGEPHTGTGRTPHRYRENPTQVQGEPHIGTGRTSYRYRENPT